MAAAQAPWKLRQGCVRFRGGLKWSSSGIGGPFSLTRLVATSWFAPIILRIGRWRGINDRRLLVSASRPDDVPSSAPVGSPDSASHARRPARPSLGWRWNGNGRLRLTHSPVASAPRLRLARRMSRDQALAPASDQVCTPRLEQGLPHHEVVLGLEELHQRPLHLPVPQALGDVDLLPGERVEPGVVHARGDVSGWPHVGVNMVRLAKTRGLGFPASIAALPPGSRRTGLRDGLRPASYAGRRTTGATSDQIASVSPPAPEKLVSPSNSTRRLGRVRISAGGTRLSSNSS